MKSKYPAPCDGCGINSKSLRLREGKYYCYNCYITKVHRIWPPIRKGMPLDKALNRTYTIRCSAVSGKYISGSLSFPRCLIGKKVKLTIVEEEDAIL